MAYNADEEKPGWGATVGVYFLSLLCVGFAAGITSMMGFSSIGLSGGYTAGGLLSWLGALASAAYYRSTGKVGGAVGIAVVIGLVIGVIAVAMGPSLLRMRYGV